MRLLLSLCLFTLFSGCDTTTQPSEPLHYSEVDVRPEPIEGFEAFSDTIEYPELAIRAGLEGPAILHFTVDEDGNVIDTGNGSPVCVSDIGGNTCESSRTPLLEALLRPALFGEERVPVAECFVFDYRLPEGGSGPNVPTRITVSHCP